jgi:hypothetical protein
MNAGDILLLLLLIPKGLGLDGGAAPEGFCRPLHKDNYLNNYC